MDLPSVIWFLLQRMSMNSWRFRSWERVAWLIWLGVNRWGEIRIIPGSTGREPTCNAAFALGKGWHFCFSLKNIWKYVNIWWTCAQHNFFLGDAGVDLWCRFIFPWILFATTIQNPPYLGCARIQSIGNYGCLALTASPFPFWPVRYLVECLKGIEFAASHQPICFDIFGLSSPWCHAFDVQYLGFDSFGVSHNCLNQRILVKWPINQCVYVYPPGN